MEILAEINLNVDRQGLVKCNIFNARLESGIHLDKNGFQFMHHTSTLSNQDFYSDAVVGSVYYSELSDAVKFLMCADDVICFQHHVRNRSRLNTVEADSSRCDVLDYIETVHIDYSVGQARDLVENMLGKHYNAKKYRYQIINAWRNIGDEPVQRYPLAVEDTQSQLWLIDEQSDKDFSSKWYCFPLMTRDEVLLFRQYDSQGTYCDACYHTSFDIPNVPSSAPPRESIETRLIVIHKVTDSS